MVIIECLSLYYILLFCLCLSFFNHASCLRNETDRNALIFFKNAIQQDPFQVLSSWNASLHFCYWHGVSCNRRHTERVVALNLNSQGLVGSLSPHIGNLSFLRRIDFQNNSFHGQIPQEIGHLGRLRYLKLSNNSFSGKIPANLSGCLNLEYLDLIDNNFQGNIPSELTSLPKLGQLGLGKNNLSGNIPPAFGNFSSLWKTHLGENHLQGEIPEELCRLSKLGYLVLSENNLTGKIPSCIFNISTLFIFVLHVNDFYGTIPSDIGLTLPNLIHFLIFENRFTGPFPSSLTNASGLVQIACADNYFTGFIPKDFGKLPFLNVLQLSSNQLQADDTSFIVSLTNCSDLLDLSVNSNFLKGSIEPSIANLSKQITDLFLSDNQFHGTIPMGIDNLINLQFLDFSNNNLTGPILIDFNKLPQLQELGLRHNKFIGMIPSSIGNCSWLSRLYMGFDNLNGTIPTSLGNCHSLINLDLSHNSLTGSIPVKVFSLSSLSVALDLSNNAFSGPIPSEVGRLQNLVKLDLSNNRLSGVIPNAIGKCLGLEHLHLEGNSFNGEIPQVLTALRGLKELDISRNNFSGRIPKYFVELHGIRYLNMSLNLLQGEVPKSGIFLNASAVSLFGNNGLCGGIPELKLPSCRFPKSKKNNLSVVFKVIIPSAAGSAIFLALLCFLIVWHLERIPRRIKNTLLPSFQHQFLRITYIDLFKATYGFSRANQIGVGSYSSVYKGFLEQAGIEVAVKMLNLQQSGASNSFTSECKILSTIRHRNLLKLLSVCCSIDSEGNDVKALIYEFMANGSLEKWLHPDNVREDGGERESQNLKLIDRLNIAIDIAIAVDYLHNGTSSTIVHGDLKPSNVLLDEKMTAHIGDFGLTKIVSSISGDIQPYQSSSLAIKGSIGYVAPEYGMGSPMSIEGDVYSYGILLLEIFTGKKPTDNSFRDGENLHGFVTTSLPYIGIDIVDSRILSEDRGESFKYCILSVLKIGVACSMEQPRERMKMHNVISELLRIKSSYFKGRRLKPEQLNVHKRYEGPSTSCL